MGKQKAQRRKARQTKEQARQQTEGKGLEGLKEAVNNGQIQLSPNPAPPATVAPAAPAPVATSAKPAPQKTEIPMTVAGKKEYDVFFRLYDLWVRAQFKVRLTEGLAGKAGGTYFLPLGFIPGPAILLSFKEGKIQANEATPDVAKGMKIPTPWLTVTELPQRMQEALEEWCGLVAGLGYEPSAWSLGFARRVLGGRVPSKYLAMAMPHFRYRPGDPERPFGVVLVPVEGGMKVERVYNPQGIPDVPATEAILTLTELKDGRGPVQKLLRTWTLMEVNYFGRYGQKNDQTQQPHWSGPSGPRETKAPTRRPTW